MTPSDNVTNTHTKNNTKVGRNFMCWNGNRERERERERKKQKEKNVCVEEKKSLAMKLPNGINNKREISFTVNYHNSTDHQN